MDLQSLNAWAKETADRNRLRALVRKDTKGLPRENDVTVCMNFLVELQNRIRMVQDHTKKAEKFMGDITEFVTNLEKRGVVCPKPQATETNQARPQEELGRGSRR